MTIEGDGEQRLNRSGVEDLGKRGIVMRRGGRSGLFRTSCDGEACREEGR